jgi:hypothetical protein
MATNTSSKRPATTLRCGDSKATICLACQREGSVLRTTLFAASRISPVNGATASHSVSPIWEALMHVAFEAKEWIATHALKR